MSLPEFMAIGLFICLCLTLMAGYPVAFTLGGLSLLFAGAGVLLGVFDPSFFGALPSRLFGTMNNATLLAVPLFVFMGVMLEKSRVAEDLLESMSRLFGGLRGGLAFSVCLVGALLAASTGIVGATVVTLGLLALPTMLKRGYDPALATGTLAATGTLGQIIPPSIVLVLLGDVLSNAYQQAQLRMGIFSPKTVTVGDLFMGSLLPGLLLVALYLAYLGLVAWRQPHKLPAMSKAERGDLHIGRLFAALLPPLLLIFTVLGSILWGIATPTEAAAVGAVGATLLVMLVIFLLGFILDFIEITFVVVPIVGPVLLMMGLDPIWLGVMIALNLQTSFLTPPFGFALFYLRGVTPPSVPTSAIYRGVLPFILIQLLMLVIVTVWPGLITWLPGIL